MYKIMLADDEGIVIDSLKFIIEKEFKDTCEVQYAKTGRSVIELAESFRPDVAVMDIQMPGINGIDAMKEIRRSNNHTVFIVMSAYQTGSHGVHYQADGEDPDHCSIAEGNGANRCRAPETQK